MECLALLAVYGHVPPYKGRGHRPTRKQPSADWHYAQILKQRVTTDHLIGIELRVIYGDDTTLERTSARTTGVERTKLTSRPMNARLVRKTLGYSKRVTLLQATCAWDDMVYNLVRPINTLRCVINAVGKRWLPCSPMMTTGLTDHLWSIREVLMFIPIPTNRL